ncbi:nuclear transport factor 2 family protein [Quadrisphaera setariae]|uniref:nuclear transport factor 2 family protein n=1 Tax=Quadrisphaera setariae TaxID=2593304 RepID=UPI0034E19B48
MPLRGRRPARVRPSQPSPAPLVLPCSTTGGPLRRPGGVVTACGLPVVTLQELADRLERVETELAVHRSAADHCIGAAQEDLARFASTWTADALWDAPGDDPDDDEHRFRGLDAITAAVKGQRDASPRVQHATADHTVERDSRDPDAATGRRDVVVTVQLPNGRWVLGGGVYEDRCERAAGVWRIADRCGPCGVPPTCSPFRSATAPPASESLSRHPPGGRADHHRAGARLTRDQPPGRRLSRRAGSEVRLAPCRHQRSPTRRRACPPATSRTCTRAARTRGASPTAGTSSASAP